MHNLLSGNFFLSQFRLALPFGNKKHSKADIDSLRLSDEMIESLQQGKNNIPF